MIPANRTTVIVTAIQFLTKKKRKSATGEFSNTVPVSTAPDQEPVEEELSCKVHFTDWSILKLLVFTAVHEHRLDVQDVSFLKK